MTLATTTAATGFTTLFRRRLGLAFKTRRGILVPLSSPLLMAVVIAPALDSALGSFSPDVDYMTYVAIASLALLVPLTSMFNGLTVITDGKFGITRELLAAPIPRVSIPLGNAAAILAVALLQSAVLLGAAAARGARFDVDAADIAVLTTAIAFLSVGTYGLAETLAHLIGKEDEFVGAIPAVAIAPWFLAGTLFPIAVLPAGLEQLALALPWTHAVAVFRFALSGSASSGLGGIWGMESDAAMVTLSLVILAAFTAAALALASRTFQRTAVH